MKQNNSTLILLACLLGVAMLTAGCSAGKNTARSRWWQAFNTRYNVYYNGATAYVDGSLEKEQGNRDNFTEIIPLYTVANKNSKEIGKSNFEKAITKCEKAIQLHSIKQRPTWDKKRRKTERDIEWLSRREYNPFMWKVWLLMGRAQFHKGDFDQAASTFAYMSRLYRTQPHIYGKARAWLARTYIEQGWMYDAEDVIRNMQRDSIDWRAVKEWDFTLADYYIHTGEYEKAITYLREVIRHEMRRKQRAREWFLMGQLQTALGNRQEAYKAFGKVVGMHASYELDFNARIAMTEVMAQGQARKMIGKLRRMAASDNNKDYLDQVYYAIGNIWLAQKDTLNAISAYENGNKKATRNGIEKGVLMLRLGNLYWDKERFVDARRCYNEALGMLDQDRADYKQLSERSKMLDELVPHIEEVHLQDSLQQLAKMPEKERNAAIDRVIAELKKKEKEERDAQSEAAAQQTIARNSGTGSQAGATNAQNNRQNNRQTSTRGQQQAEWYFYNPLTVSQGKATFERQWGKRENVDNWQRINKTVVAIGMPQPELTEVQRDSLLRDEARRDSLQQMMQDAANDPHQREFYMAQIPFTQEKMHESNAQLTNALYHAGIIFKDRIDNLTQAEKNLIRIVDEHPDFEKMDDVYYHLFLLYSRMNRQETARRYVELLKEKFPKSQWTTLLSDPNYMENARTGVHREDSLYAATYEAFKAGDYATVKTNVERSERLFANGANRDKFIFIGALSKLNEGNAEACIADMQRLVEQYQQSKLAETAGMIINGVKAGRRLQGGRFDVGNVWQQRTEMTNNADSTARKEFVNDRNANFVFLIAYSPDSTDENRLLFELARYNFTNYLVRNFDIEIQNEGALHRMIVRGFRNYDEALQYARELHRQAALVRRIASGRTIIISEPNLELLGRNYSYDDYDSFYNKHFLPLKVSTFRLLTEPEEIVTPQTPESTPTVEQIDKALDEMESGAINVPDEKAEQNTDGGVIVIEDEQPKPTSQPVQKTQTPDKEQKPTQQQSPTAKQQTATKQQPKTAAKTTAKTTDKTTPKPTPKTQQPATPQKPAEPQKKKIDLEDEYYDVEGF